MNQEQTKYQQQILFDEIDHKAKDLPASQAQVIIENSEWEAQETELADNDVELTEASKPNWLWRTTGIVFTGLIAYETVDFFIQGFVQSPFITSIYATLLGLVSLIASGYVFREYRGLKQFKQRQRMQKQAKSIYLEDTFTSAHDLCQQISEQLPCDILTEQESNWSANEHKELSDKELLTLYSREVLSIVDQKALDKVSKHATEAAVLVALSPIAVLDMLLMLWRNTKMINEIAALYGMKISYWSRIKLIKQTFKNMVYAGASELITDVGADLLSADMLSKLSGRLAQGLGAGMLTARLGLKAMQVCRPIPYHETPPKLKAVRSKVIGQIKTLLNKKAK
ncbi:YcjF family protein [Thalassotalea piscium]|uniref:Putative membrane protein n=1 Tax=Thalassotalea piscium TaxID=1230533 RepID=A0A7X0TTR3_9GAMM|nr:TIGR01620 family protein [Thalassotalea piscium]MBB6543389.1 putative membrane protein [Thalassotalea piscium]